MTPSLTAKPPLARRPARNETTTSARRRAHGRHNPARQTRRVLERYVDCQGSVREVLTRAGAGGSVLVMDRDARTRGDTVGGEFCLAALTSAPMSRRATQLSCAACTSTMSAAPAAVP